ncbi:FUSC family protein [Luteibacter aegosomatissinici]|uniref:FUSC family protein n=1 Tax=Luteibacter aegosomatissinici TaxID=2911539 RepID=UPI001FFBF9E3|nr:FUSC family protein [Luteibacter aegosomatissinici]UPG92652.1 FUSC family protein [Luteibacter aegosomatissinici]
MIRTTACATLVATVFLVFRVPLPAYGAYVVLMASQRDMSTSAIQSAGAFVAGLVSISASLLLYMLDISEPALRIPLMAGVMFLAMFASRLERIGPVVFLAGFLLVVTQTLADQIPDAEALTHLLLWLLLILGVACALVPLVEAAFGRSARAVFDDGLDAALRPAPVEPARADVSMRELAALASRLGEDAMARLGTTWQIATCAALARTMPGPTSMRLLARAEALRSLLRHRTPFATAVPVDEGTSFDHVGGARFALKATLAAMTCYVVYSALDWSGLRTSIITCFFVALASTGETIHKLGLRLAGAATGGFIAGVSIIFLFPVMDDIGSFIVLFFLVTLGCSWIATAGPLIAYAGLQTAFAFFLGVLQDTGPTDDLTVLRDRLIGILLGNIAMSVVFATLWPISTQASLERVASRMLRRLRGIAASTLPAHPSDVIGTAVDLEDMGRLAVIASFEPARDAMAPMQQHDRLYALTRVAVWTLAVPDSTVNRNDRDWLCSALARLAEGTRDGLEGGVLQAPPTGVLPDDLVAAIATLDARPFRVS